MSMTSAPAPGDWDYRPFAPVPFGRFRDELLRLYEPPLRSRSTLMKMKQVTAIVAELVGPAGSTADLNPDLVRRFIASRPPGECPRTTHTLLSYLRSACSYARSQCYIRTSPFDYRKKWVRLGQARQGGHHSLEEIRRVLESLASEVRESEGWARWRARRMLAIASLFAYCGLRKNEGLGLHAGDVDLEARMISLVEREGSTFKTEKSARPVPIPDALAPVLADWMGHRLEGSMAHELGGRPPSDTPWMFPGVAARGPWKNGPMGHRPLDQLRAAGERAGVRNLSFLSLRHSFATHSESWGLSEEMVKRILRHTSVRTQSHYKHPDLDNMRRAVDRIDFGPDGGPTP